MGADLFVATFVADTVWSGRAPGDLEDRVAAMVAAAGSDTLARLADHLEANPWAPDNIDAADTTKFTATIVGLATAFFASLGGRDVTTVRLNGNLTLWVTGGLSTGDSPTDAYEAWVPFFDVCDWLPVAELVGIRFSLPDTVGFDGLLRGAPGAPGGLGGLGDLTPRMGGN